MIRYALRCPAEHSFDSWFASADAYEALAAAGHVACPVCGAGGVTKALMAPRVQPARDATGTARPAGQPAPAAAAPDAPAAPVAPPRGGAAAGAPDRRASAAEAEARALVRAIARLRREVEANAEYVGRSFAREARAIHDGEAPERPIWGEADRREAAELIDEGVAVAPLPFVPRSKLS